MNYLDEQDDIWDDVRREMEVLGTYEIGDELQDMGYGDIALLIDGQSLRSAAYLLDEEMEEEDLDWEVWERLQEIYNEILGHAQEIEDELYVELV